MSWLRNCVFAALCLFSVPAAAQVGCVPNPNISAPPFFNGCNVPASALNNIGLGTAPLVGGNTPLAACNNVADDTAAINARLASGAASVYVGPVGKICYHATAITIPDGVTLSWQDFSTKNVQSSGLRCGMTSGTCVTVGSVGNGYAGLNNVAIFGAGSGNSQTCVNYNGQNNITSTNVYCQGFKDGFVVTGNGTTTGIYFHGTNLYTCNISDAHIIINQATGVYFTNPILGCDGAADVTGADYVRIIGNWDTVKGTLHFVEPHFNLGLNTVGCVFNFKSFTGSTNQFLDFSVLGGHIEAAQNYLCSDSSVGSIAQLEINGGSSVGGNGTNHFFNLNAATEPEYWVFNNNTAFAWGDYTLAPTVGPSVLNMSGNHFPGLLTVTAASGGDAVITDNNYLLGATINGGGWLAGQFSGTILGGSYTFSNNALQNLNITVDLVNCNTLGLAIGGSSAGITYSAAGQVCSAQLFDHHLTLDYFLSVTSLGGLTGNATITGMPLMSFTYAAPLGATLYANMTGISGGIFAETNVNSHAMNLIQPGATNLVALTNSNFGTCSSGTPCVLQGSITYLVGGN